MKQKWVGVERRKSLREDAEALVADVAPEESAQPAELLMHQLLVHKVALELQDQELRQVHVALEEARGRYGDLYDFAPLGYITINGEGMVSEMNTMGAAMLGMDRSTLIGSRFSDLVATPDRDRWHRLFMSMMEHAGLGKKTFELEMIRADASLFHAHLDCLRLEPMNAPPVLHLALADVSKLKHAEAELRIAAMAFESTQGMMVTDAEGMILRVNQVLTSTTGYTAEEFVGQNPRILQSGQHDARFFSGMWASISDIGSWEGEIWNKRKDGEVYLEYLTIGAVKNVEGIVTNYVASYLPPLEKNTRA
jgi:PAS domain S-box-containing protein